MIIVEPHADDAFLSMGGIIEASANVTIITVYSGTRKRAQDAKAYADAVGAKWIGMGFVESGSMDGEPTSIDAKIIFETIKDLSGAIILPLGVGNHREHEYVTLSFIEQIYIINKAHEYEQSLPPKYLNLQFYVDMPYAAKMKHQRQLYELTSGKEIVHLMRPSQHKWRYIKHFKDQQKFFYFENGDDALVEKTFELVVK